jgi:hypothetical protein
MNLVRPVGIWDEISRGILALVAEVEQSSQIGTPFAMLQGHDLQYPFWC